MQSLSEMLWPDRTAPQKHLNTERRTINRIQPLSAGFFCIFWRYLAVWWQFFSYYSAILTWQEMTSHLICQSVSVEWFYLQGENSTLTDLHGVKTQTELNEHQAHALSEICRIDSPSLPDVRLSSSFKNRHSEKKILSEASWASDTFLPWCSLTGVTAMTWSSVWAESKSFWWNGWFQYGSKF